MSKAISINYGISFPCLAHYDIGWCDFIYASYHAHYLCWAAFFFDAWWALLLFDLRYADYHRLWLTLIFEACSNNTFLPCYFTVNITSFSCTNVISMLPTGARLHEVVLSCLSISRVPSHGFKNMPWPQLPLKKPANTTPFTSYTTRTSWDCWWRGDHSF